MTASVNGRDVISASIREPRVGIWTAELDVDAETPLTGDVEIIIDGVSWRGTVLRGDVDSGHYRAWIVGGEYGLAQQVSAKHYIASPARIILREILSAVGETQAPSTDAATLNKRFERWSRALGTAGSALAQLATDCGVSWRMLRDGRVWLGPETWPDAKVVYEEIEYSPARGHLEIAPESPTVKPGETFDGGKVSSVTTTVDEGGSRQAIVYEDDNAVGGSDRQRETFVKTIESVVGKRLNLSNWYTARVVSQSLSDNTVDLLPDDERMRGTGISRVPLRHGLPGCTVKVKPGSRCTLYFEDNDAKKPAAGLWPDGSSVLSIAIAGDVSITGNLVVSGTVTASDCIAAAVPQPAPAPPLPAISLKTHVHNSTAPGTPSGPPIPAPVGP